MLKNLLLARTGEVLSEDNVEYLNGREHAFVEFASARLLHFDHDRPDRLEGDAAFGLLARISGQHHFAVETHRGAPVRKLDTVRRVQLVVSVVGQTELVAEILALATDHFPEDLTILIPKPVSFEFFVDDKNHALLAHYRKTNNFAIRKLLTYRVFGYPDGESRCGTE